MTNIFISYRTVDTSPHAERLHNALANRFGRHAVFYDNESIRVGQKWEDVIRYEVENADVLVVLIGEKWITELHRRQQSSEVDYLVLEICLKLKQIKEGGKFSILPLLLDGAVEPSKTDLPPELCDLLKYQMQAADTLKNEDIQKVIWAIQSRHYPNEAAYLSFWRPSKFMASACECRIYIDGEYRLQVNNGDRGELELDPGEHEVYIRYFYLKRGDITDIKSHPQKITFMPGHNYAFVCRPGNLLGRPQLSFEQKKKTWLDKLNEQRPTKLGETKIKRR